MDTVVFALVIIFMMVLAFVGFGFVVFISIGAKKLVDEFESEIEEIDEDITPIKAFLGAFGIIISWPFHIKEFTFVFEELISALHDELDSRLKEEEEV